jgi:hypothetical protein
LPEERQNDNIIERERDNRVARWTASLNFMPGLPEYIRREVTQMTAFEIISIFIGILALLIAFGSFVIALLAFLDKRNKRK